MKGEAHEERPAVTVNLGVSLRIDEVYIPEENQRLRMYKRIAGAENEAVLTDARAELEDRYGKPPEAVLHLLARRRDPLGCANGWASRIWSASVSPWKSRRRQLR